MTDAMCFQTEAAWFLSFFSHLSYQLFLQAADFFFFLITLQLQAAAVILFPGVSHALNQQQSWTSTQAANCRNKEFLLSCFPPLSLYLFTAVLHYLLSQMSSFSLVSLH